MNKIFPLSASVFRKRTVWLLGALCWLGLGNISQAQTLIDPAGAGGFELGTDFASNGWTVVNGATTPTNKWQLGNVPAPFTTGNNSAYVSNSTAAPFAWAYTSTDISVVHFYRDVTFPAGQTDITLSFNWQGLGEPGFWDALIVSVAPTTYVPVASTTSLSSGASIGAGTTPIAGLWNQNGSVQTFTTKIPAALVGNCSSATTLRLIFTWKNDGSGGVSPPSAVDNISLVATAPPAPLAGTYSVGPTGTYSTIRAAVADANLRGVSAPVIFELQSAYTSAGETFPINISNFACPSATPNTTNNITLRPALGATGLSIINGGTTSLFNFDGGIFWNIDGRPGGAGTTIDLTLSNTNTSGNIFTFLNESSNNSIRYCNIASVSTSNATILFSTTTGANGNDNNTITNNNIRDGATLPTTLINSSGTSTTTASHNSGNIVSNNNIFNFNTSGIVLGTANISWTISGNSFYQTAARNYASSTTVNAVLSSVTTSGGHTISNNFIGGSAPNCGGTAMTLTGNVIPRLFQITSTVGLPTSIQGNTFRNMSLTSSNASPFQSMISMVTGDVNITNNIIGGDDPSDGISVSQTGSSSGFVAIVVGSGTPNIVTITGNDIRGITHSGTATTVPFLRGISWQGTAVSYTISNNQVGSPSVANSFTSASNSGTFGLISFSNTIGQIITNNTVSNLSNTSTGTGASANGILFQGSSSIGTCTLTGNTIRDISASSTSTTFSSAVGLSFIANLSTSGSNLISQNTIFNIRNTSTGTANTAAAGAVFNMPSAISSLISRNLVYGLSVASTGTAGSVRGFSIINSTGSVNSVFANNMIRLGLDATGADLTGNHTYFGITHTSGIASIIHNTVYIGGTGVGAGTLNTFAFNATPTTTGRDYRNNIFVNVRSNGVGTGKHYAIALPGTAPNQTGLTCNNNLLFANGTGGFIGLFNSIDQATLSSWQTATGFDVNSVSENPPFINATSAVPNLRLTVGATTGAESGSAFVASITNDFDNEIRQGNVGYTGTGFAPDMGADEFEGVSTIPACNGAPAVTTTVASPSTITCAGGSTTLSLNPSVSQPGLSFQWQSATSLAGTYTNISGATSPSYVATNIMATTYYRCAVTCANPSASTTNSTPVEVVVTNPVITTFPYIQNFNALVQPAIPACWNQGLVSGTNNVTSHNNTTVIDGVTTLFDGLFLGKVWTNSNGFVVLPPMNFASFGTNDSRMEMQVHRNSLNHSSDVWSFYINTTPSLTGATLLQTIPASTTTTSPATAYSPAIPAVTTVGWYNYKFTLPSTFNNQPLLYVIIQGVTAGGSSSYGIGMDNFKIEEISPLDVQTVGLAVPATGGCYTATQPVSVTIRNNGSVNINFATNPVTITTNVTGTTTATLTATVNTGTLAIGANLDVPMTTPTNINMSVAGTYTFNASSVMAGDINTSNDAMPTATRTVTPSVALPLEAVTFTGFDGGNISTLFPGWSEATGVTAPNGTFSGWGSFTNDATSPNLGADGNVMARINYYSFNQGNDWFVGPKFVATATTALKFSTATTPWPSTTGSATIGDDDGIQVMVSTDCGGTWSVAQSFLGSANFTETLTEQTVSLSSYAGQQIIVAVRGTTGAVVDPDPDFFLYLDDIKVIAPVPLDIQPIGIVTPSSPSCYTATQSVTVKIRNNGTNSLNLATTPITVTTNVSGAGTATLTGTASTGTIAANGGELDVVMTGTFNMSAFGAYTFGVTTVVTGDGNTSNDNNATLATRTNVAPVALPQNVNFTGFNGDNTTALFPNWYEAIGATNPTPAANFVGWNSFTNTTASPNLGADGNVMARINYYSFIQGQHWFVGPKFTATSTSTLKFSTAVTIFGSVVNPSAIGDDDGIEVMVSTNCGASWTVANSFLGTANFTTTLAEKTVSLSAYNGQQILVAVRGTTGTVVDTPDYYLYLDNIRVYDAAPIDMAAVELVSPGTTGCYGTNQTVTVKVKNFGALPMNFATNPTTVTVNVTGAVTQTISTTINTGTLAVDATQDVVVSTTLDMSVFGTYTFNANTTVTVGVDGDATNDAMLATTRVITTPLVVPLTVVDYTGFTGANLTAVFPNWNEAQGITNPTGTSSNWGSFTSTALTPNLGAEGNVVTRVNYWSGNQSHDWFVGPKFTALANTEFVFKIAATQYNFSEPTVDAIIGSDDEVRVRVSTDCGATWTTVQAYGATSGLTATLTEKIVPLGTYAGQNIILAIQGTIGTTPDATEDYYFFVDDLAVKNCIPPSITTQPSALPAICAGSPTSSYTVVAAGDGLTYQWQVNTGSSFTNVTNGTNYSGATTATLNILNTPATFNTYKYRVVITGRCGSVTSNENTLTVNVAPVVTTEAQSTTICEGTNTILTVAATSFVAPTFQWQMRTSSTGTFTNLTADAVHSNVTSATLNFTNVPFSHNAYEYRCVISNTCGSTNSSPVVLTVTRKPVITVQPLAQSGCANQNYTFSVTATSDAGALTYQWQEDEGTGAGFVNLVNDADFSGVNTATLTATNINSLFDGDKYRCIVTNSCGSTTSDEAMYTWVDTQAPVFAAYSNITFNASAGNTANCAQVVTFATPTATDNCATPITIAQTAGLASGATFPVGVTNMTFTATDAKNNVATLNFTVTVVDNVNPALVGCPTNITVNNTTGLNSAVVTYIAPTATDNCAGATVARTAGLASGSVFPLGVTTVTHEATDASGNKVTCSFTVTVNFVNATPSFTATNPATILEDAGAQTIANWAAGNDNDEAVQTLSYEISNISNAGLFSVAPAVSADGTLTYTAAPNANGTSTFQVRIKDDGGVANGGVDMSVYQTFTITVTAVNDAPSFTTSNPPSVLEDVTAQTVTGIFVSPSAGPADESSQTFTYFRGNILTGASLFSVAPAINVTTGELTYTPAPNAFGTSTVEVYVKDNGGVANGGDDEADVQIITITINGVNDAPSFTALATIPASNEDAGVQTVPNFVTASSAGENESAQTINYEVEVLSNPTLFSVAPAVSATGTLTYTAAPNANGTSNFRVRIKDNGGTANGGVDVSAYQTFTITVNAVNDAPTLGVIADREQLAGTSFTVNLTGIAPGGGTDEASQTLSVTSITAVSGANVVELPTTPITVTGGIASFVVKFTTNIGTAQIRVTVKDNGGTANGGVDSVERTFTVTSKKQDEVFIPETFSPNGDGDNDFFRVKASKGLVKTIKLIVQDANGKIVFESDLIDKVVDEGSVGTDLKLGWDGKNQNGVDQPQGTYIWKLSGTFSDGRPITATSSEDKKGKTTGTINLVRGTN